MRYWHLCVRLVLSLHNLCTPGVSPFIPGGFFIYTVLHTLPCILLVWRSHSSTLHSLFAGLGRRSLKVLTPKPPATNLNTLDNPWLCPHSCQSRIQCLRLSLFYPEQFTCASFWCSNDSGSHT